MDEKIYVGLIGANELRDTLEATGVIECITGSVAQVTKEIRGLNKEIGGTIPVFVEDPEMPDSGLQRWCEVFPSKTGTPVVIIRQGDMATLRNESLTEIAAPVTVNTLLEAVGLPSFEVLDDQTFPPGAFVRSAEPEVDEDEDELDQLERALAESEEDSLISVGSNARSASEQSFADHEQFRGRSAAEYETEPEIDEVPRAPYQQEQYREAQESGRRQDEYDQPVTVQHPDSFLGMPPASERRAPEFVAQDTYPAQPERDGYNKGQLDYQNQSDRSQTNSVPRPQEDRFPEGQYGGAEAPAYQGQEQDYRLGQAPQGGFMNQPRDQYNQYGQQGMSQPPYGQQYGQQERYGYGQSSNGYQGGQQAGYGQPPYGQNQPYQDQRNWNQQSNAQYARQQLGHAVIILASKGGVGKSSSSIQMAHEAGKAGMRVILIDANSGQPDLMVMLGLERSNLPTIQDAALSNDVGVCFLSPDQINHFRSHDADQVTFGFVAAPLSKTNRRGDVSNYFYAQVIEEARRRADLVIVDTQILENDDKTGIVEEVFVPVLQTGNGWAIGVTECSAVSVNSLEQRFRDLTGPGGIAASKFMTLFNKVDVEDMEEVVSGRAEAFRGFGEVLGAIPESRVAKLAIDNRELELDTPLFSKRILAALLRIDRSDALLERDREIEAIMAGPEKEPNFLMRLFKPKSKKKA
ncbi:ParA family protein [Glutamicibacter ardleyensis]|uniref:ParA family protein n=1 Tax=Glutamicibacter ardleyensis TaxID=225894 RepID=UPI003FD3FFAF